MMSRALLILLLISTSCYRAPKDIEPCVNYTVQDRYLKSLPSPFPPMTNEEKNTRWGTEYLIGQKLARDLDFYRAITALKRAEILVPEELAMRKLEIQYEILLSYYLGRRYQEVENAFSQSNLHAVNPTFPAYHDLLLILYDTYLQLGKTDAAYRILTIIEEHYPKEYQALLLSAALQRADFPSISYFQDHPYVNDLLCAYNDQKKSVTAASMLNAALPGSGYLYLGQTQTAITAFLINGLFIAATVYFFKNGPTAAGIITASFEAGWYFGGIQGGAAQAKFYNERLYESLATPMMNREKLFPVFRLEYNF